MCRWARILAYQPPTRLVFSWDISPYWQIETDSDRTSEVEVRFIAESPSVTRVELEHRHLDRHGHAGGFDEFIVAGRPRWTSATPPFGAEAWLVPVETIDIDRTPADVFAYVTDPGRFNEWQDGVVSGQRRILRSTAAST